MTDFELADSADVDLSGKELREKYNITGDWQLSLHDPRHLILLDVLGNVFSATGRYTLVFEYHNLCNYCEFSDADSGRISLDEVAEAWTGSLTDSVVIEIIE